MELPSVSDGPKEKQDITEQGFELRSVSDRSPTGLKCSGVLSGLDCDVHVYTTLETGVSCPRTGTVYLSSVDSGEEGVLRLRLEQDFLTLTININHWCQVILCCGV